MLQFSEHEISFARQQAKEMAVAEFRAREGFKEVAGRLTGCCPMHGEHTPSFSVWLDDGHYKCFGCGASGDAIALAVAVTGGSFAQVVRALLNESGAPLPSIPAPPAPKRELVSKGEVSQFWDRCIRLGSATRTDLARRWADESYAFLRGRGLDVAALMKSGSVRMVRPFNAGLHPVWLSHTRPEEYRLAVPLYDCDGHLASVQLRQVQAGGSDRPKTMNPRGARPGVFATRAGRAALVGHFPGVALVVEGLTDFLAAVCLEKRLGVAVLGYVAGSARVLAESRLNCVRTIIATDSDSAGDRYAQEIMAARPFNECVRLSLPALPGCERSDFSDWNKANQTRLIEMVEGMVS